MPKKKIKLFLKRPKRFMIRFSDKELRSFRAMAERCGISQVEFARRKILDIPIAEIHPGDASPGTDFSET